MCIENAGCRTGLLKESVGLSVSRVCGLGGCAWRWSGDGDDDV